MKKPFLSFFKALAFTGVAASLIFITSCGSDDDGPAPATETIWGEVSSRAELSALASELENAGLDGALNEEGAELTLFAPTNSAMETLLGTLGLDNFDPVNPLIAQAVLTYHVLPSIVRSSDLTVGGTVTTLQGEDITVAGGPVLETGATSPSGFVTTDIETTNGVIHIIDVVMVPPTIGDQIVATLGTVAQPLLLGADFTILAAAVQKADTFLTSEGEATLLSLLSDATLTGEDQITVFAPTNATFEGAGITLATYDGATWANIISHHVVVGQGGGENTQTLSPVDLTPTEAVPAPTFTSALGLPLVFSAGEPGAIAGEIGQVGLYIDSDGDDTPNGEIVLPDADGGSSNGRIHAIAGVLAPPAPPEVIEIVE